uniref:Uncharacterized protein n=1 Tax=Anguilla anguilla TaxID=7936 RepID=A0A0E9XQP4_ANGAN
MGEEEEEEEEEDGDGEDAVEMEGYELEDWRSCSQGQDNDPFLCPYLLGFRRTLGKSWSPCDKTTKRFRCCCCCCCHGRWRNKVP